MSTSGAISLSAVVAVVAERFQFAPKQLIGREHGEQLDYARAVAIWLAKAVSGKTASMIGQFFDWRDEDTVLNEAARIGVLRFQSPNVLTETDHLLMFCGGEIAGFNMVTFSREMLALHPSARAASGEQLGLLCSEYLRAIEALESPNSTEKKSD